MISLHPQVLSPNDDTSPSEVLRLLEKYPPRLPRYAYGTAGFRYDATVMDAVLVRVAVFCAWWYPQLQAGNGTAPETIGIMVTASHNDESYNGVKLVAPNGEILADPIVQGQLTDWVNSDSTESNQAGSKHPIRVWIEQQSTNTKSPPTCIIHIGHDTRSHSPSLTELAVKTIRALGGQVIHHGVATTPLLHHAVFHQNPQRVPSMIPIRPDAVGYYQLLSWSYLALLQTAAAQDSNSNTTKRLVVDCACGVGYPSVKLFQSTLQGVISPTCPAAPTEFYCINGPTHGPLNENCGSEHVQKSMAAPQWYRDESNSDALPWEYCAAVDGDADRIVFFHKNSHEFFLLDGDKITVLICEFLQAQVAALKQACQEQQQQGGNINNSMGQLTLGAVQTAYANGASTKYLKNILGSDNVLIAKTGVQHVHHAAKSFDIGVYFEANGHGTVVFGPQFYSYIAQAEALFMAAESPRPLSLQRLRVLPALINQAVGDAVSDLLLVDAILHIKGWDLKAWNQLYSDMPSRMSKLKVTDRNVVKTNENDTICLAPENVQEELNAAMKEWNGRCFVRASGTEDVVRVYAEAETRDAADQLSAKAEYIVHTLCGGVGDPPKFPASRM
ncbi:Phosphoacetylglucosamine mutase [Seminavis robusta]|uniref:Phosphoacetylglucosamine mutase n=1 Tax=Seminavis robusta TaxID=568900 RepID=A0A9N8H0P0_9STRA|nr:Phosphoacetylglucosamine mutase [Seminavis robusta]|eukprot:Sro24_g016370.1 Phosphoacetylglucosamine mutase (615) ;mRNA; r:57475-59569